MASIGIVGHDNEVVEILQKVESKSQKAMYELNAITLGAERFDLATDVGVAN